MNTSLALRIKMPNKKQKSMISITEITNQDFRKLIKEFRNSPYLGYNRKHVHNELTEAYVFLINHIFKPIKIKKKP